MLRISRRPGESIVIGGDIVITVIGPRKGETEIGVVAPRGLTIARGEPAARPAVVGTNTTTTPVTGGHK